MAMTPPVSSIRWSRVMKPSGDYIPYRGMLSPTTKRPEGLLPASSVSYRERSVLRRAKITAGVGNFAFQRHRSHLAQDMRAVGLERDKFLAGEAHAFRDLHLQRIYLRAVDEYLVVQMRPRRQAGIATVSDDLALTHARSFVDARREAGEVGIARGIAITVVDLEEVAVTVAITFGDDRSATGGHNGRSHGHAEVDAFVHPAVAQYRMKAHPEDRCDARAIDWRF